MSTGPVDRTPAVSVAALRPEHAFVVELRPHESPAECSGRVEHVVSGEAIHFDSSAKLLEFMRRRVGGRSRHHTFQGEQS